MVKQVKKIVPKIVPGIWQATLHGKNSLSSMILAFAHFSPWFWASSNFSLVSENGFAQPKVCFNCNTHTILFRVETIQTWTPKELTLFCFCFQFRNFQAGLGKMTKIPRIQRRSPHAQFLNEILHIIAHELYILWYTDNSNEYAFKEGVKKMVKFRT